MYNALTLEQIKNEAPSVFATTPWHGTSEKYRFVPTVEPVAALLNNGFVCVSARQAVTRIPGKGEFTRHVLRFRTTEGMTAIQAARGTNRGFINDGPTVPEVMLLNSHDGTSAYKLMLGMFRLVCTNGMVVSSGNINEIKARHSGRESIVQEVIDGSFRIIDESPKALAQIGQWQQHQLTDQQQVAYATAALELRDSVIKPDAARLLEARRMSDRGADVWTTFNRVQENMIRGGIGVYGRNATTGRRSYRHTRAIQSVTEDTKLNRALWRLTEELAKAAA